MKTSFLFSKDVVLASASPRRSELLRETGLEFRILPSETDESKVSASNPKVLVRELSKLKARAVAGLCAESTVIAADTVVYRKRVYGKPLTMENAINMLSKLNDRWHSVYTGVTVLYKGEEISFVEKSRVKIADLTHRQIEDYVIECSPIDKAGAYGIQDGQIVEKYKGSYSNIVGLPMEKLNRILTKVGVIDGSH